MAGDSPQFSALTASNAPPQAVGSVLTLVNSIGFGISIVSIQLFVMLAQRHDAGHAAAVAGAGAAAGRVGAAAAVAALKMITSPSPASTTVRICAS